MSFRHATGVVLLGAVAGGCARPPASPAPALLSAMQQSIDSITGGSTVGFAFCWYAGGQPLLLDGHGYARAPYETTAPGLAMTAASVVPLASTSKPVTAVTLLAALDQKGLDAEATVGDILGTDGVAYGPHVRDITVAQLLSHTSGFDFRDAWFEPPVRPGILQLLAGGTDRSPGGDASLDLWTAGQGPPPAGFAGPVYSNVNYFTARILVEQLTGMPFEDAAARLVLGDPAFHEWSVEAEPEPRTLGYSRWAPGSPGSRTPDSFRGLAGPVGWHASACGLAAGAWALLHGDVVAPSVRTAMLTRRMGIFRADVRGTDMWYHDGVWTPGGRAGFEVALAGFSDQLTAGFVTNTWGNFRASRVLRQIWEAFTPVAAVSTDGQETRLTLSYDAIPGAILRWSTDTSLLTTSGKRYDGAVAVAPGSVVHAAAFLDGQLASLPLAVRIE